MSLLVTEGSFVISCDHNHSAYHMESPSFLYSFAENGGYSQGDNECMWDLLVDY